LKDELLTEDLTKVFVAEFKREAVAIWETSGRMQTEV